MATTNSNTAEPEPSRPRALSSEVTLPNVRRGSVTANSSPRLTTSMPRPVQLRNNVHGGGGGGPHRDDSPPGFGGARGSAANPSRSRTGRGEEHEALSSSGLLRPNGRLQHADLLLSSSAPLSPRNVESLSASRAVGMVQQLPPLEAAVGPQRDRLVHGLSSPPAEEVRVPDAAAVGEELTEAFNTFICRLPAAWLSPIVRAVTLQTVTEHTLLTLLTSVALFDAYTELKSEVCEDPEYRVVGGGQPAVEGGDGSTGPLSTPENPKGGGSSNNNCSSNKGIVNLTHLLMVSPAILRYSFNTLKENKIKEIQSYEKKESPQRPISSRASIAMQLLRPRVEKDINFGVCLVQGAKRAMPLGSRLFLPQGSNGSTTNTAAATPRTSNASLSASGAAITVTTVPTQVESTNSAVSFTSYPSIFLKYQYDMQHMEPSRRQRNQRRRHVQPFFEREFASVLACGHGPSCLFAATLSPEFLVGLPSFLTKPQRAISSAIRATLHRLYNVLTGEALRLGLHTHPNRHLVRAPAVDMSILYVRDNHCYYASTPGIEGKLLYLNAAAGAERLVVDLDEDFGTEMGSNTQGRLGNSFASVNSMSLYGGTGVFDMPNISRSKALLPMLVRRSRECAQQQQQQATAAPGSTPSGKEREEEEEEGGTSKTEADEEGDSGTNRFRLRGQSSNTVPTFKEYGGENPADSVVLRNPVTRFPHAVVSATVEVWSTVAAAVVSDLLRAMLCLNQEAAAFTLACNSGEDSRGVPKREADAFAEQVGAYVNSMTFFTAQTRNRLLHFYEGRVAYYTELDEHNARTPQQKLTEELRAMAVRRQGNQGGGQQHNNSGRSSLCVSSRGSRVGASGDSDGGGSAPGTPGKATTVAVQHEQSSQSLCDAMASVLHAEVTDRWLERGLQSGKETVASDEAELLFNRSLSGNPLAAKKSEDTTLTFISDILGESTNNDSGTPHSFFGSRSARRSSGIQSNPLLFNSTGQQGGGTKEGRKSDAGVPAFTISIVLIPSKIIESPSQQQE